MKGISTDVIRLGKKYRLQNFGDVYEFEVIQFLQGENFKFKDLSTLEIYEYKDLVEFGKGKDFEIVEI
ncbi:hypothetical protein [Fulvivirga lutea]|uniref:Uncharacterized protein n=1 Tax=Fulvivirga lutea TaxID=2810512 RepID=A0A975A1W4_9BACT|nr:hypothetical protein [Fulvivirga lutea]QSE97917.1 hypothetical protein JR347_02180 [Fulvivirga lutea]